MIYPLFCPICLEFFIEIEKVSDFLHEAMLSSDLKCDRACFFFVFFLKTPCPMVFVPKESRVGSYSGLSSFMKY